MGYALPFSLDFSTTTDLSKGRIRKPDWEYSSGFRVGAGLDFAHDGWDTYLNYTWFHPETSKDSTSITPSSDPNILTTLRPAWNLSIQAELSGVLTSASERWRFRDDVIDWELGRRFFISSYLTLRPYGGLKTAWQKQRQKINFTQLNIITGVETEFILKNRQKFWGIGICAGLDTNWYVYKKNLSLIADLGISGLWSYYKVSQKQESIGSGGVLVNPLNIRDSYHAIRPIIEWSLGMQWESWLYDNAMKISLSAAWEEQIWFNQNNLLEFARSAGNTEISTVSARGGDLSIQGLTIRGRFDF